MSNSTNPEPSEAKEIYEIDLSFLDETNGKFKLKKFEAPEPSTPMTQAAFAGDLCTIRNEIENARSSKDYSALNAQDESKNTALIWAVDGNQVEIVKELLSINKDDDDDDDESQKIGSSPPLDLNTRGLICATDGQKSIFSNNISLIEGFLGATAISRACRRGNLECVNMLLEKSSINPDIPNGKLQYPLHFAAFKQHKDVVLSMLESGKCPKIYF